MCRCIACDSMLSVYDMSRKRKIKTDNGFIEVYEDMCSRCRSTIYQEETYEFDMELSDMGVIENDPI